MEITQDNFEQCLPLVYESIEKAEYIAIDCEFSGYTAGPDDKEHEYDTTEERYQKIRSVINKFVAFQIGICTFHWDDTTKKYKYRPFSFYVWPKSKISDISQMFQSGAVSFLIQNNFDFNKLFDKGINYGRFTDAEEIKELCNQKIRKTIESIRAHSILSKTHQTELEDMLNQTRKFVYDPNTDEKLTFQIQSYSLKKALSKRITEIYMNTGIYTEFSRQSPDTVIKKSKQFKQVDFLLEQKASQEMNQSIVGGDMQESNISGKNTAVTIIDPVFGFCEEMDKSQDNISSILEIDESNKSKESKILDQEKQKEALDKQKKEFEIEEKIEKLFQWEIGFSQVIEYISKQRKPIIGHNMKFDLAFMYHQFYKPIPDTYIEYSKKLNEELFPSCYDTKVFSVHSGRMGKSDLQHLYHVCTQNKKYNNNLVFEADLKQQYPVFSVFEQNGGQGHDAGFDAFMTGLVFATLSKFIEIGNIINIKPKEPQISRAQNCQKREILEKEGKSNNKRNRKALDKEEEFEENKNNLRKIKHFSAVQNKQIYYTDISHLQNRIMMSIDVPCYWYLDQSLAITEDEQFKHDKIRDNVIYLKLKQSQTTNSFGKRDKSATVFQIAELFNKFGDINVVKNTENSCYIEIQDVDTDLVRGNDTVARQIIKLVQKEINAKPRRSGPAGSIMIGGKGLKDIIEQILEYKDSEKFVYDGRSYAGRY